MLLMIFYVIQQEVCLPLIQGIPVKLWDEVLLGKLHSYLHGFLPKYCSSLIMLKIYTILLLNIRLTGTADL